MASKERVSRLIGSVPSMWPLRATGIWWTIPAIFLLLLRFGNASSLELDPTWSMVLRWAYTHSLRWGSDIVFTYGPLGFLTPQAAYYPSQDRFFSVAQILFAFGQAVVLTLALRAAPRSLALATIAVLVVWLPYVAGDVAWYATFAFAAVVFYNTIDHSRRFRWVMWIGLDLLLAATALIKFTSVLVFALTTIVPVVLLWRRRQRIDAVAAATAALVLYFALWLASGQSLAGWWGYTLSSLNIAQGYAAGMGLEPERWWLDTLGLSILVALNFGLFFVWFSWHRGRSQTGIVFAFMAVLSYLVWRAAFIRADEHHVPLFFAFASLLPLAALSSHWKTCMPARHGLLPGIVVAGSLLLLIAVTPLTLRDILPNAKGIGANNLDTLRDIKGFELGRKAQWEGLRASIHLPRIAAIVGNESVDMLMVEQGVVLSLGFNYRPRPVFQSYSAYTPTLAKLNEAHFIGADAPRFVLLKMQPMDFRFPMQEDSLALAMLLKHYRPRVNEAGFLLLEQATAGSGGILEPEAAAYHVAHLSETVELPPSAGPALLFADIRLNWRGQLRALLLREPELVLNLTTSEGQQLRFRLVRSSADSGFVISPLILDTRDWVRFAKTDSWQRVTHLSIAPRDPRQARLFRSKIRYAIVSFAGPFATADLSAFEGSAAYFGFSHGAAGESHAFDMVNEGGRDVVFMHAPAWMDFDLDPGVYTARGAAGLMERITVDRECISMLPDGVAAKLTLRDSTAQPRTLWQARINPFAPDGDPKEREFATAPFRIERKATLRFSFSERADRRCDWSYLRDLQIQPVL